MEVLCHIRPYFGDRFPYKALTQALYVVGTSNQSVPEMAIEIMILRWGYKPTNSITGGHHLMVVLENGRKYQPLKAHMGSSRI